MATAYSTTNPYSNELYKLQERYQRANGITSDKDAKSYQQQLFELSNRANVWEQQYGASTAKSGTAGGGTVASKAKKTTGTGAVTSTGLIAQAAGSGSYDSRYTKTIDGLLKKAKSDSYDSPYTKTIDALLKKAKNNGTYTSDYKPIIDGLLADAQNSRYDLQYTGTIEDLLNQYRERSYQSRYGDQIAGRIGDITSYGDYQSEYADDIADLTRKLQDSRFTYDRDADPNYQAARKLYLQEADRTASDVLGKASAATGGRASSYAVSAASQAANYFRSQLAEQQQALFDSAYNRYLAEYQQNANLLSELRSQDQTAYGRWTDSYNQLLSDLGVLQGQDQTDYSRYLQQGNDILQTIAGYQDLEQTGMTNFNQNYANLLNAIAATQTQDQNALNQWQANYNAILQRLGYYQAQDMDAYQQWAGNNAALLNAIGATQTQDQNAASQWQGNYSALLNLIGATQTGEQQAQANKQQAYSNLVTVIGSTGYSPSAAELKAAGMSREEADAWKAYYNNMLAMSTASSGGSGGGGGGGGGRNSGNGSGTAAVNTEVSSSALPQYSRTGEGNLLATASEVSTGGKKYVPAAYSAGKPSQELNVSRGLDAINAQLAEAAEQNKNKKSATKNTSATAGGGKLTLMTK